MSDLEQNYAGISGSNVTQKGSKVGRTAGDHKKAKSTREQNIFVKKEVGFSIIIYIVGILVAFGSNAGHG